MALRTSLFVKGPEPLVAAVPSPVTWNPPKSSPGERLVHAAQTLMHDATDPVLLGSMLGAQFSFGLSRLALTRFLPQGLGWGKTLMAANGGAFAVEGLAFLGSERGLQYALDRTSSPDANFSRELGHTYLTLGLLKGLGGITSAGLNLAYRDIPKINLGWQDRMILAGAPQAAALTGIYLSHGLAPSLGLADPISPSENFYQSALTLLNFGMAGALLRAFPAYSRANQEIQHRTRRALQQRWENLYGSLASNTPAYQHAMLGPASLPEISRSDPRLENIFKMDGNIPGRGNPKKVESRIQIPAPSNGESFIQLAKHLAAQFPEAFGQIEIPPANRIVTEYPKLLTDIELARINSPDRLKIAQTVREWVLDHFKYTLPDGRVGSLREGTKYSMAVVLPADSIKEVLPPDPKGGPGYRAIIRHSGVVYDTLEKILAWTQVQLNEGKISPSVAQKIKSSAEEAYGDKARAEGRHGYFRIPPDFRSQEPQTVVLVSGGAELAPLKFFVEGGARVLVVDLFPLGKKVEAMQSAPGGLYEYQASLLTEMPQIASAIWTFAKSERVSLGFYPYADGWVWPLSAASQGILEAVGEKVETVLTLRSPSVVTELPKETAEISERKWSTQRLRNLGTWFRKNLTGEEKPNRVAQSIVAEQRLPYAVGNWIGKTILSEARLGDDIGNITFSPVGPISFTGSMSSNKMIVTALKAAHLFDVDVVPPYTSRDIQAFIYYDHYKNQLASRLAWVNHRGKNILFNGQPAPSDTSRLMADHADLGIFAQPNALSGLVYPAGIAGILGVDGRKKIPEGLRKRRAGTYIAPDDPSRFQKVINKQQGPLARAIGLLPKSQLVEMKERGDQIHLTIDEKGQLSSVRLYRENGSGMEFRIGKKEAQDERHVYAIDQMMHLGRSWQGQKYLTKVWKYDALRNTLSGRDPRPSDSP